MFNFQVRSSRPRMASSSSSSSSESDLDSDLEEQAKCLTTCSICMDKFKAPKVLPCQHTFCLGCLQRCYDSTNSQRLVPVTNFPCPTCRKVCYVPRQGLQQLPTDFRIGQILDLMSAIGSSFSAQQQASAEGLQGFGRCAICRFQRRERQAESFCIQCDKSLCPQCLAHHAKTAIFKDHVVINGTEPKKGQEGSLKCVEHEIEMKYYCEECVSPLCTICVLSGHDDHTLSEQSAAVIRVDREMRRLKDETTTRVEELRDRIDFLGRLRQEHNKALQESERNVRNASKEAARKIRELEEQTIADLKSNHEEKMMQVAVAEDAVSKKQGEIQKVCESITQALCFPGSKQFFETFNNIQQEFVTSNSAEVKLALQDGTSFVPRVHVTLGELEKKGITIPESKPPPAAVIPDASTTSVKEDTKRIQSTPRKTEKPESGGAPAPNKNGSSRIPSQLPPPGAHGSSRQFEKNKAIIAPSSESNKNNVGRQEMILEALERRLSGRLSMSGTTSSRATSPSLARTKKTMKWLAEGFSQCPRLLLHRERAVVGGGSRL